jgi:serine/threonine-protein kinase
MVIVTAGDFVMGKPGANPVYNTPEHIVTLSEYRIDVCEVTNAQWMACVEAGACTPPHYFGSETRTDYYSNGIYDPYPVIYIDWTQASLYCQWEGKRLPTEAEWEKAARGGCELFGDPSSCDDTEDRRTYPWGEDEPTCELANFADGAMYCVGDTDVTGSRSKGASPYGILNLSDNVYEYVQDWDGGADYFATGGPPWIDPLGPDSGTEKVHKGGIWAGDVSYLEVSMRGALNIFQFNEYTGLRCASD